MFDLILLGGKVLAVVVVVFVLLAYAWPWIKEKWGASIPADISTAFDAATAYADEAVAGGALGTAALLFKKHGDTEAVTQLGVLWGKAMAWDDAPAVLGTPATVSEPTNAELAAKLAAIEAQLKTSTGT